MTAPAEPMTVVIRAESGRDEYNDPTYVETNHPVQGIFAPASGAELTDGQDQVNSQPQALLLGAADLGIDPTSAVIIRGKKHEVDGEPQASPFGGWQQGAIIVTLKRETG